MSTSAERIIQVVTPVDATISLLVLGCSINDANTYAQTIRNSGIAVHLEIANNPNELDELLGDMASDIILVNCDAEEIDFTTAIKQIREVCPIASFILLSDDPDEQLFFAAETRAQDIIQRDDYAHLIYVVSREQHNIEIQKKLLSVTEELSNATQRCDTLTETSGEAIAYIHEGMHVYGNPAYIKLFEFNDASDLEGLPIMDLVANDDRLKFKSTLRALSSEQKAEKVEISGTTQSGKILPICMEFSSAKIDGEACTQITIKDQSPDTDLQHRISELSNYDMDTGLYNRKYFMDRLEETTSDGVFPSDQRLSLIYIDVGNYGDIKDQHGIHGSDTLLKDITKILSDTTYETDLLARFGEHEFSVLCTSDTEATALAKRLLHNLQNHVYKVSDQLMKPAFSIGIAHSDSPPASSAHDFVNHVHKASKQARTENSQIAEYVHIEISDDDKTTSDEQTIRLIDRALQTDQFRLAYQPIVSLHGNSREDYAVYVRLLDDTGKLLTPAEFLGEADKAERMAEIDRWVIRHAIKEVAEQRKKDHKINFFLTLSSAGIQDDSLLLWICDCLREFKAKGAWLTIQIKQRDVIRHLELVEQLAEGLKKINCRIALDYFNCEQEAINLIKHVAFDFAKFAPDVCANISTNKEQETLLSNYNEQLQALDIKTIVTAIDQANQLAVLWNVGVNYIQGNFIQEATDTIAYDFQ